jgi:hypothetical protein
MRTAPATDLTHDENGDEIDDIVVRTEPAARRDRKGAGWGVTTGK